MAELKNLKHEGFCKDYISGHKAKDAYLNNYTGSANHANTSGYHLLNRKDIRQRCLEILNANKALRLDTQLRNLANLSVADKQIVVDKVLESVQDNPTRMQATKTILELHGLLAIGNSEGGINIDARSMAVYNIGKEEMHTLGSILDDMKAMRKRDDYIDGDIVNPDGNGVNNGQS